MTPERFQQIEALYDSVLACKPEERSALLDRADPEVRRAVERMLLQEGATLLDRPAWEVLEDTQNAVAAKLVGRYEMEGQLGEGGMGVVYRAMDTKLNRPVAIKFLSNEFADAAAR